MIIHLEGGGCSWDKIRGGLPSVRDEGGVVLDLVGEDGSPVVSTRLPHNAGVLLVALNPEQVGRVWHILHNQRRRLLILVQLCDRLAGVAARVQFRCLCDRQAVVVGLDEPRLSFKVNPPSVLLPVDLQLEVGVGNSIAPECCRIPCLHLIRLWSLRDVGLLLHHQATPSCRESKLVGCVTHVVAVVDVLDVVDDEAAIAGDVEPVACELVGAVEPLDDGLGRAKGGTGQGHLRLIAC